MKNFIIIISLTLLLVGCGSSPGPMKSKVGIIETPAFEPLFLASTKNRSKEVKYKAIVIKFTDRLPAFGLFSDILVIADDGVFLVEWDTINYSFIHKLELPYSEIKDVKSIFLKHSFGADSEHLQIISTHDDQYNFFILNDTNEIAKKLIRSELVK
jgi:hypothetical protein